MLLKFCIQRNETTLFNRYMNAIFVIDHLVTFQNFNLAFHFYEFDQLLIYFFDKKICKAIFKSYRNKDKLVKGVFHLWR